jgi:hypothetical protein
MFSANFFNKYNKIMFTQHPADQTASEGSATFTAEAKSSLGNPVTYQWQKGQNNLLDWNQNIIESPSSSIWSLTYGNGIFLMVGAGGTGAYAKSEDGTNWTTGTMSNIANWGATETSSAMTCGNGTFLTVGPDLRQQFNGQYMAATSADGTNWTYTRLPGTDTSYSCVAFLNGQFFAGNWGVFTGTSIYKTTDGTSWTKIQSLANNLTLHGFAYGNGKYVVVGGVIFNPGGARAAYASSTDGTTWTEQSNLPETACWTGVAFGKGTFVAVSNGMGNPPTDSNLAATSTDGVEWTPRTLPATAKWTGVKYRCGMFVCTAYDSNIAAKSEDGINWTIINLPSSDKWAGIEYGNGTFAVHAESTQESFSTPPQTKIITSPATYSNVAGATSISLNLTNLPATEKRPYRVVASSQGAKDETSKAANII